MTMSDENGKVVTEVHSLPDRKVTSETLEDAYVAFILYCNPGLPADCDIEGLREAFRNPPRSGGQIFDPWVIFNLVQQFYAKEIKTWTELTVKLGVQPPDPTGESTQKIAQYGVRLKKWLHSMHVKAFFEYLMGMENEYWLNIPPANQSVITATATVREGIPLEDDMALRALVPYLRPKRGRKRPEPSEGSHSPAQRQRTSPGLSSAVDETNPAAAATAASGAWPNTDVAQTPLLRWPQSAVTPTMRAGMWEEALMEPKSAITPTKRRGAKNVSSAWKAAGADPTGRTRGRPPVNRTPVETPTVDMFPWMTTKDIKSEQANAPVAHLTNGTFTLSDPQNKSTATKPTTADSSTPRETGRPARPSISLQVPDRPGSSVRLATPLEAKPPPPPPPPKQQRNGTSTFSDQLQGIAPGPDVEERSEFQGVEGTLASDDDSRMPEIPEYYFENMTDRANIDEVMAYFVRITHESKWFDVDGKPAEAADIAEASAIINSTLQNMYQSASSPQAFLINLSALAGARMLMTGVSRCTRLGEWDDMTNYKCDWEYRFGNLTGHFTMSAKVPFSMWRAEKKETDSRESDVDEDDNVDTGENPQLSAKHWQSKYRRLLTEIERKDKELFELRNKVFQSLREQEK